ncbi:MAG: UbiA family prenyltransferase [Pseudanabaena sp. ELA645]|jgi:4-hydroxybenzoate polyprenyltransferase
MLINGFRKFYNLLLVSRALMSPLTISAPIMGWLTVSKYLSVYEFLSLGIVGFCFHLFGFALNDILDLNIDKNAPSRKKSPLVIGKVKLWEVWSFTLIQIPVMLAVYYFLIQGSTIGLIVLCSSIILGAIYDIWSKQGNLPKFLAELALASSIGMLSLVGALSKTEQISLKSIIFALSLTLLLLLLNSVPSGLKDLKTDFESGAKSFVISAGCRMRDSDQIFIPKKVWIYSTILQVLIIVSLVLMMQLFVISWQTNVLVVLLTIYAILHLRMILSLKSFTVLRRSDPLLNGFYNYYATSLFVLDLMPFYLKIFYILHISILLVKPWYQGIQVWRNGYFLK